jgi:hypothetical protein
MMDSLTDLFVMQQSILKLLLKVGCDSIRMSTSSSKLLKTIYQTMLRHDLSYNIHRTKNIASPKIELVYLNYHKMQFN